MTKVTCPNCEWTGTIDQLATDIDNTPNLMERISPGETVPYGECPECGALCHEDTQEEDDLRAAHVEALLRAAKEIAKFCTRGSWYSPDFNRALASLDAAIFHLEKPADDLNPAQETPATI